MEHSNSMSRWILWLAFLLAALQAVAAGAGTLAPTTQPTMVYPRSSLFLLSAPPTFRYFVLPPDRLAVPMIPGPMIQSPIFPNLQPAHNGWIPRTFNGIQFFIIPIQ
jgi:hypothetical protein